MKDTEFIALRVSSESQGCMWYFNFIFVCTDAT